MSENTAIEWADSTFNPWEGCTKVGPGCDHCYAENRNARFGGGTAPNWGPGAPRRHTSAANWNLPLRWEREAATFQAEHGHRRHVFCASLADVFDNEVDPSWRADLFRLIADTPNLDWLLLTKRIGNAAEMIEAAVDSNNLPCWPWPRVWLGATVVNQEEADRDIPKLLATPAAVRFLSMEPLLGPVDLRLSRPARDDDRQDMDGFCSTITTAVGAGLHWVIVGGESGREARPMHPQWARDLRDQCVAAGVPYLFKQWGEWAPLSAHPPSLADKRAPDAITFIDTDQQGIQRRGESVIRVGKKAAGRLLDGVEHNGFPKVHRG